jgi:UDP-N-acetylmuramoyl-tripeptide--D-alanyl-D-alanine ligase
MVDFTLLQLLQACGGVYHGNEGLLQLPVSDVVIDSRKAREQAVYVPIRGERFDGHAFITDAFNGGAMCCLSEHPLDAGINYILVRNSLDALQDIAAAYHAMFGAVTVGVTGSAGKTTTKDMIASVLAQKYNVLKTEGNFNNQTGVPLTLFRQDHTHGVAVVEMGMNHFGEIRRLSAMARPDICVITNIGDAHIEYLGSKEGIFRAKSEMMEFMKPGGAVVVNGDDPFLAGLKDSYENVKTFGFSADNDFTIESFALNGLMGSRFTLTMDGKQEEFFINVPGQHMLYNALCAVAVGSLTGVSVKEMRDGLNAYSPESGRMRVSRGRITVLDDTYNANPVSMAAAIDVLAAAGGRRVAVLGEMYELGRDERRYHREIGEHAAEKKIDLVLCVGMLTRETYLAAEAGGIAALLFENKQMLEDALPGIIKDGDTVLIKASHGMRLDTVSAALIKML